MNSVAILWTQILTSVFDFGIIAVWYVRPYLTTLSLNSALTLLLFVHVPRYVGMTLLVSGMVDPKLPRKFLSSTAYGDLLEAALALASIFALRVQLAVCRSSGVGGQHVGIRGPAKRMYCGVLQVNLPSFNLGTIWYIYTFYGPLVVVSHLMIFWILIKSKSWKK